MVTPLKMICSHLCWSTLVDVKVFMKLLSINMILIDFTACHKSFWFMHMVSVLSLITLLMLRFQLWSSSLWWHLWKENIHRSSLCHIFFYFDEKQVLVVLWHACNLAPCELGHQYILYWCIFSASARSISSIWSNIDAIQILIISDVE